MCMVKEKNEVSIWDPTVGGFYATWFVILFVCLFLEYISKQQT